MPAAPPTYELSAYQTETFLPAALVEETFNGRALAGMLSRKLLHKLSRGRRGSHAPGPRPVASFAGLVVFHERHQHMGGLAAGQDFPRVLNELGIGRRERLAEFCAGPGYIGYQLLAAGWCERLALVEIDSRAVASARHTARVNGLEDRVAVYESDVLASVPESERWDVVVANPPHYLPDATTPQDLAGRSQMFDEGWEVHRRFYATVKRHMQPGGVVVVLENQATSDPAVFEQMIVAGGGFQRIVHPGTDVRGRPNGLYYQVSEW